ncbi:MAG: metal ABC transporter ATP-binding protein [Alphaproteobacteria bacterium]
MGRGTLGSKFLISFEHIAHHFGDIVALDNINLTIPPASLLAIIGPNGGGKSTLLKLIAGLYQPTRGKISSVFSGHKIAFLPQRSEMDRTFPLRVFDVAAMGLWKRTGVLGRFSRQDRAHITEALAYVGLQDLAKRPIYALSGGQFQRLLFARLALQDADLILLDEPFSAVDLFTVASLMNIIQRWHQQGKTILTVVHDLELVRKYFPTAALISQQLICFGDTATVLTPDNLTKAVFHA